MNKELTESPKLESQQEVVGLIPASGRATRIAPLPCSKELYPIGFRAVNGEPRILPKVVCHYLLEKMRLAGIAKAYVVLREGKWDIPTYLRDGSMFDMHIAYLMMNLPFGVPYTLDQAYPFVREKLVAVGFPDILFQAQDAFVQLLARQTRTAADVILGLFYHDRPETADMVEVTDDGRVQKIVVKPRHTDLIHTWIIAVWTPAFTRFMHDYLDASKKSAAQQQELHVSEVIQAAIQNGLRVEGIHISDTSSLDIGTPEDLVRAVKIFSAQVS